MCGTKVCEEQKQNMEDTMLELLEDCPQKELYCMHNDVEDLIKSALNCKLLSINLKSQRLDKEKQEVKNIVEQAPKRRTRLTKCLKNFKVIHNESIILLNKTPQISSVIANTPDLPTEEPKYSLSMRDEHLSTIPETKSDEVIKSSDKNLVPILSEFVVTSNNESECDVPVNDKSYSIFMTFSNPLFDSDDDFSSSEEELFSVEDVPKENFKIYSNPFFDNEIISSKINPHHFNDESDLIESLLNRDILTISYPKIDSSLEEFSGELAHIDLVPPGINKADFDPEEEIHLIEELLYDNSSPRPSKKFNSEIPNAKIESFSPSPIRVEDSDSHLEKIDLFLATDDLMPPGIKNDNYESEGDIYFLEELLSDDPLPIPKNESSNFDHHDDPSFARPPPKPPDVEVFFDFEPDTSVLTAKVVKEGISLSWKSRISISIPLTKDCPRLEASHAHGFVHRLLKLQSLAYGNPIS
nr:hypothetical protein [Tanacetum cinerariifolium]